MKSGELVYQRPSERATTSRNYNKRNFGVSTRPQGGLAPARKRLIDLQDQFELDGHVEGELSGAEGQPGMAPGFAENLNE